MIFKNIKILKPMKMNTWRQIALSAWNRPNEPVIYSKIEMNAKNILLYLEEKNKTSNTKLTLTHVVGKICGIVLHEHDDLNSTILMKKAYIRKGTDIFFHVSSIDETGKENLSGVKVEDCALKSLESIAKEISHQGQLVKTGQDVTFNKIKKVLKATPMWLCRYIVAATSFIQNRLNLWSPVLGTKQDPFGAMMITNIGSLGIKEAFVPFSHYANVNSILSLGACHKGAVVVGDKIEVGTIQNACWTLDHRVIDGSGAAKMLTTFMKYYDSPELIDRFDKEKTE